MSSISKASADRQKRVLTELLAQPGNNVCADCSSPAPRWASWNIGIFLCVQCATAHRKLGSHISKVKSVTLDTWTKEQVESVRNMGNVKANALYNPDPIRNPPPTNMDDGERDSEIETYIRNKYQYKAFMKRDSTKEKEKATITTTTKTTTSISFSSPPSSSASSRRPPPDLTVRTANRSVSARTGTIPSPSSNIRDVIDAVSPSASTFLTEMQNHTRELQAGNRARSTPPSKASGRPATAEGASSTSRGTEFTSVGVTPPTSGRPSTATAKVGGVPAITTTPPAAASKPKAATMAGGGFSWGGGAPSSTASTASAQASTTTTTSATNPAPPAPVPPVTAPAPPAPPPQRELSLFERDLMSLQGGPINAAPPNPMAPSLPTNNPFPMGYPNGTAATSPPPFMNGMAAGQSPFGATALSPSGTTPFAGGGMNPVQSLTTGFAGMSMGGTGLSPSNPFGAMQPHPQLPQQSAPSPFASVQPQPTGGISLSHTNPFGGLQNPPYMMTPGASFQPSSSPAFQQPSVSSPFQQPGSSPFQQQQPSNAVPFQPSSSPFQAGSSPFQSTGLSASPFQQAQPTGLSSSPFQQAQPTGLSSSPFQQTQPTGLSSSPFQTTLQTQPTGLSSSPFGVMGGSFQQTPPPFQQASNSFTSASPFGQQFAGASTFSNASTGSGGSGGGAFAAFAQGMLPKTPGQQQQPGSFNPFFQQQQQQRSGTMPW